MEETEPTCDEPGRMPGAEVEGRAARVALDEVQPGAARKERGRETDDDARGDGNDRAGADGGRVRVPTDRPQRDERDAAGQREGRSDADLHRRRQGEAR